MRQAAHDRSGGLAGTDFGELNQPGPPPPSVSHTENDHSSDAGHLSDLRQQPRGHELQLPYLRADVQVRDSRAVVGVKYAAT